MSLVDPYVNRFGAKILRSGNVKKVSKNGTGKAEDRGITISDVGIYLFKGNKPSKEYGLHGWMTSMQTQTFKVGQCLVIKQQEKQLKHNETSLSSFYLLDTDGLWHQYFSNIYKLILTESETHDFDTSKATVSNFLLGQAIQARYKIGFASHNPRPTDFSIPPFLSHIFKIKPQTIYIDQSIIDRRFLSATFSAFRLMKINSIILPESTNPDLSSYEIFAQKICDDDQIEHVSISGAPNEADFTSLVEELTNEYHSGPMTLNSITFVNSEFTQQQLAELLPGLTYIQIQSLGLVNSVATPQFLFDSIFKPELFNTLKYLSLDGTHGLILDQLVPLIGNISVLSLSGIGIPINEILPKLKDLTNLKYLNVGNNDFVSHLDPDFQFPPALQRLDMDRVTWYGTIFQKFFPTLFTAPFTNGLRLSAQQPNVSETDIAEFSEALKSVKHFPLCALRWGRAPLNVLTPEFLEYIGKATSLTEVRFDDCVDSTNIQLVADCISKLINLQTFVLRGGQRQIPGQEFDKLVEPIKLLTQLKRLNVSYTGIGDQGLNALTSILQTNFSIEELAFDQSNFTSYSFEQFINTHCGPANRVLRISWPIADIEQLQIDPVKEADLGQMAIKAGIRPGEPAPDYSESLPFHEWNDAYLMELEEGFPMYINQDVTFDLNQTVSLPPDEVEPEPEPIPDKHHKKSSKKHNKHRHSDDEEEDFDDAPPPPQKKSRKRTPEPSDDEEESEPPVKKKKSPKRDVKKAVDSDDEDDYSDDQPKKKPARKIQIKKMSRVKQSSDDDDYDDYSDNNDDDDGYSEEEKPKKKITRPQSIDIRKSFIQSAPKVVKDHYVKPEFRFPRELEVEFDVQPAFKALQEKYSLSELREKI